MHLYTILLQTYSAIGLINSVFLYKFENRMRKLKVEGV